MGETIRLNGVLFTIVGVLHPKMQEGADNDRNRQIYIPFSTMSDLTDTKYLGGIWFNYQGNFELIEQNMRATLGAAHHFRPTDHNAIYVANLMTELHQFSILSLALQVLLSLVGALTLGIAGIGLMNIMLVAVQQRTREIGVEKALGAHKRHILIQFLAEAMAITGVGGICGIALAYLVSICCGAHPVLQRTGAACRGRRHPTAHLADFSGRGHVHPGRDRTGERHDSGHPRGEPGSDRVAAVRIARGLSFTAPLPSSNEAARSSSPVAWARWGEPESTSPQLLRLQEHLIQRRASFTISSACVRAELEQNLHEVRRVKNNAAPDHAMERSIALIVAPVWVRPVCQEDSRNIG